MESQIENLKQKFWKGKTSVEEEKMLKKHFQNESSSKTEAGFFAEIAKRKTIENNSEFSLPHKKNRLIWQITTMAASVLILVTLAFGLGNLNNKNPYTIDDPQQAFEISRKALMLVSTKLNKGRTYSAEIYKINEVKQIINK